MKESHPAPEIFSTSFLDLISCALAGVIILWVLTLNESSTSAAVPSRSAVFIQLAQRGVNHFQEARLTFDQDRFTFPIGSSGQPIVRLLPNGTKITIVNRSEEKSGADLSFAASALLSVEDISDAFRLDFTVNECFADTDLHFVQLIVYSTKGVLQKRYLYQEPKNITTMQRIFDTGTKIRQGQADVIALNDVALPLANFRWLKALPAVQVEPPVPIDTSKPARWALTIQADGSFNIDEPEHAQGGERGNAIALIESVRRRLSLP
ncbi:hypothetical protein [Bradyrhizobium sp. AZCC 1708]|uniref:hypothetical protein n=1 Tax=Bradyrhizobium sp. AZCC 1708 TaxID=3117015 RepID=UPI002FF1416D